MSHIWIFTWKSNDPIANYEVANFLQGLEPSLASTTDVDWTIFLVNQTTSDILS